MENKIDFRTVSEDARFEIRKRGVQMVRTKQKSQKEVALLFGVRPATVNDWCKRFKENGMEGLREGKKGPDPDEMKLLSEEQEQQVQEMILDRMPDQLKLRFALWTRAAVRELIEREFGIALADSTMGEYLRRWGYTPQKPAKRAYEQQPARVQKWMEQEYPAIAQRAKEEGAEIQWGDETGVRNECQHGRSYAPKGRTPVREVKAKRMSVNMISTVTNRGQVRFMLYEGTMNSEVLLTFLKRLIRTGERRIFLVLDNLRVHHSAPVKQWAAANSDRIELFFLPPYSPERNPDEYLNCDLKDGLSRMPPPKDVRSMKDNVRGHMRMLQRNPKRVASYFRHEAIKYAA